MVCMCAFKNLVFNAFCSSFGVFALDKLLVTHTPRDAVEIVFLNFICSVNVFNLFVKLHMPRT